MTFKLADGSDFLLADGAPLQLQGGEPVDREHQARYMKVHIAECKKDISQLEDELVMWESILESIRSDDT